MTEPIEPPERPLILMSPAEAMQQAIERAQLAEWDGASVWLDIARELRLGGASNRPAPKPLAEGGVLPRLFDRKLHDVVGKVRPADNFTIRMGKANVAEPFRDTADGIAMCRHCDAEIEPAGGAVWKHVETGKVACAVQPMPAVGDTAVMRFGPDGPATCGNCGHAIELSLEALPVKWVHQLTFQQVCPVSAPGQAHTFAEPRVDARG